MDVNYVKAHPVLHKMWFANKIRLTVSDTHKARRSASPGHHTGWCREQNCSGGLKSCRSCFCSGEWCFQFLSLRLSKTLDKSHAVNLFKRIAKVYDNYLEMVNFFSGNKKFCLTGVSNFCYSLLAQRSSGVVASPI